LTRDVPRKEAIALIAVAVLWLAGVVLMKVLEQTIGFTIPIWIAICWYPFAWLGAFPILKRLIR
jgi:hypothetical protein